MGRHKKILGSPAGQVRGGYWSKIPAYRVRHESMVMRSGQEIERKLIARLMKKYGKQQEN